ncbi:MAG: ATP-binding protein [Pirellulales bacterium]
MHRRIAPLHPGGPSDRRRLMLFSTAILCAVSLAATVMSAFHFRAASNWRIATAAESSIAAVGRSFDDSGDAWRRSMLAAVGETLVLVIAGGALLVRVCNPFIRRLEESDARLRAIVSTAGDGIITLDERGTINSFNQAAERMFCRRESDMLGRNLGELILLSSGLSFTRELAACRGNDCHASQKALGRVGDTLLPVELSLSRVSSGEPALFTVIVRDTTERETTQQRLRLQMLKLEEVKERLEAKAAELAKTNRDLDDFTYIASHDLKEPLRGISAYCQILLEDYAEKLDADGLRRLQALVGLCQRLGRLIDDVLTYSQIGRREPEALDADLGEVVADVLATLGPAIDERRARVRVKGRLFRLSADRVWVGEVFRNLIANALKFNDSARPRVEIGSPDGETIYVRDNGIGIAPCHHEAIFAMFRRLHGRGKYEGTGAGLSFVRKIVEAHGGRVWVKSRPGHGSTFYFTLSPGSKSASEEPAPRAVG